MSRFAIGATPTTERQPLPVHTQVQCFPGVVIVSGPALRAAADAMLIAVRSRHLSGLPRSQRHDDLAAAFIAAASASGHLDVSDSAAEQRLLPTVTVEEAAQRMNLSRRQVRRMAPRLGGRLIGGRWLLDEQAITEHIEGTTHG